MVDYTHDGSRIRNVLERTRESCKSSRRSHGFGLEIVPGNLRSSWKLTYVYVQNNNRTFDDDLGLRSEMRKAQ
jgi:hypothetical protein